MNTFFVTLYTWIKSNVLLAIGILLIAVFLFFPKVLRGLFGGTRRRRRTSYRLTRMAGRRTYRRRRPLPRSVGIRRRPRKQYTKGGKAKKPWQIKGSMAARRHMARIRRMR
jgi:hypothetical protein